MDLKPTYEELEKQLEESTKKLEETQQLLKQQRKKRLQHPIRNQFHSVIIDSLPVIILVIQQNYSITYTNAYCRELFGDAKGKLCFQYFRQKNTPCERCSLHQALQGTIETIWEIPLDMEAKTFQVIELPVTEAQGSSAVLTMGIDITERIQSEKALKRIQEQLSGEVEQRTQELKRKNIALKEVLNQLEVEKQRLAEKVEVNVQKILLPVIEKLIEKSSSLDSRYLMMIKQNLERLTSSVGIKLSNLNYNLTPKEIELCALIKGGFSIKEIATMQNLSERTVETHRLNIRRKLGLNSAKINLSSYLAHL